MRSLLLMRCLDAVFFLGGPVRWMHGGLPLSFQDAIGRAEKGSRLPSALAASLRSIIAALFHTCAVVSNGWPLTRVVDRDVGVRVSCPETVALNDDIKNRYVRLRGSALMREGVKRS